MWCHRKNEKDKELEPTCLACEMRMEEQVGSNFLKTIDAPAKAAAVSAAKSEPGADAVMANAVLGVSMSSGRSQHA